MSLFAKSRRDGLVVLEVGDELLIQDRSGEDLGRLSGVARDVWSACDGASSVAAIAEGAGISIDQAWAELDALSDAGLLEERLSPPGSIANLSRRRLVTQAGIGAGLAAAALSLPLQAAATLLPREADTQARGEEKHKQRGEQLQKRPDEIHAREKSQEQNQKRPDELARSKEQAHKRTDELQAQGREQEHKRPDQLLARGREQTQKRLSDA